MRNEEEEKYIENAMAVMDYQAFQHFTTEELCAFNNAIQLYSRINPKNKSYEKAVQYKIINENGVAWDLDSVQRASAAAVLERLNKE